MTLSDDVVKMGLKSLNVDSDMLESQVVDTVTRVLTIAADDMEDKWEWLTDYMHDAYDLVEEQTQRLVAFCNQNSYELDKARASMQRSTQETQNLYLSLRAKGHDHTSDLWNDANLGALRKAVIKARTEGCDMAVDWLRAVHHITPERSRPVIERTLRVLNGEEPVWALKQ